VTPQLELSYQGPLCKYVLIRWRMVKGGGWVAGGGGVICVSLDPGILLIDYLFIHEQLIHDSKIIMN